MRKKTWLKACAVLMLAALLIVTACSPAAPAPTSAPEGPAEEPTPAAPAATEAPAPAATEAQAPAAGEKVVLNIMHNWGPDDAKGPLLQDTFKEFMAANPDIVIKDEVYTDLDIPIKVETAYLAGQEPDIVFNNFAGSILTWIDSGVTIPVDDLIKEWGLDEQLIAPAIKEATDPQGRIVAFPLEGFTWPVWYNAKIFKEVGVEIPKTTEELIAVAPKLREAGYEPFVVGGSDWSGFAVFTILMQGTMTDDEVRQVYAKGGFAQNPHAVEGIKLFTQVRDSGVFAKNSEGLQADAMNQMFFAGKAAMMHAGSWTFGECPPELQKDIVLGGMPVPAGSPHSKPTIYAGFGKGIWITRNGTAKMDAVEKFVKFMFSPKNIGVYVAKAGMPSPVKDFEVDESQVAPIVAQGSRYLDQVTIIQITDPLIPPQIFEQMYKNTAAAFLPTTSAEQIIEDLDKTYASIEQ